MLADHPVFRITPTFERLVKHTKRLIPIGGSLPDEVWQSRHRGILALLWLHTFGIIYFGLLTGAGWQHSLAEGAILAAIATAASWHNTNRKFRSAMASFGLITASAQLVHLSGGYIEMHFHFFVMLAVIMLYQDWVPFLLAIGYVVVHHGVIGALIPFSVYNHSEAFAHPWKWAVIHGGFVLAASIANIVSWQLNEALRAYSDLILNSTGEGIIGLDLQGKITFMNPAAAEMTGYQLGELKGQPLYRLLQASKVTGPLLSENENGRQALTDAKAVNEGVFWRKSGTSFQAEYIITPIREGSVAVGAVVTFKDITERKQAEAALALARDQALESSRLKTELLSKVSHELRTPLGAILGFAELLELSMGSSGSDKQRRMMAEMIDSTHYLTKMVNELLDQAQLEAGRLALNVQPFAPTELLNETLAKMSILAQAKGLSLTSDIAANVPVMLAGDMVRLQQILVNLISNAIKFTPTGTVQVRFYLPEADQWALQVSDTGLGIPVEAQGYIFEAFRQVDGSKTGVTTGTGLGLSIVKELTSLMGGKITLESTLGRGSTFTVFLPMQPVQEEVI